MVSHGVSIVASSNSHRLHLLIYTLSLQRLRELPNKVINNNLTVVNGAVFRVIAKGTEA